MLSTPSNTAVAGSQIGDHGIADGIDEGVLTTFFSETVCDRIACLEHELRGTPRFHDPLAWRYSVPELAGLDFSPETGRAACSAARMMEMFRLFGVLSLDLRDVPGLGHGRILNSIGSRTQFLTELRQIAHGKSFVAICITEEQGGSDLHALQTTADRHHNGYTINGTKSYVARLRQADFYIVFAGVHGLEHGLSAFLVRSGTPGLSISDIHALGLQGISWGTLQLENVHVGLGDRIGGEGQGFSLFSDHFTYWRCAMAAAAIGCAQAALNRVKQRLHTRYAFSGLIGRFSHLQQEYAVHASRLHMAWLLVQDAARRIEGKLPGYMDSAMAKAEAVEAAIAAVQWAMLVHGAYGYSVEAGLEKRHRDLLGLRIADGTTDVLRGQVARGLLGDELYALSLGRDVPPRNSIKERRLW
ncbi:acyl-CoA dehydrogenase [Cupriavidus necator]|uniref:Medium-chain specific acyl-CoA dehydrogenase, mitochondrial n=1 Tax=Cupriavidus necator TaxID=106590 RepID=A0A1U9UQN5_CUPNE|nr:acyl-CoA dehydrogenase [Cupriavidus necator]AQV94978.1 acyl-CoA dehydrogenase [Cupriavidus necator]